MSRCTPTPIDTILRGDFIRDAPDWLTVALIFALSLVAALAMLALPMLAAALCSLLVLALYVLGASYYFDQHIVLNLVFPPLASCSPTRRWCSTG